MTKKKTSKKSKSSETQTAEANYNQEFLILGHLIKYNVYLLTKAVIFSAVSQKVENLSEAANITNTILSELDLDTKQRSEMTSNMQQEELQ